MPRVLHTFHSTSELFDRYYREVDQRQIESFNRNLAGEFRERLEQLDWLLERIRQLELQGETILSRSQRISEAHLDRIEREGLDWEKEPMPPGAKLTAEEGRAWLDIEFEMKLLTESFYYIAGRARAIARHREEPLPGLRTFEAEGVRNVRNHLIEHPEGSPSRVFLLSWAWGGPQGPVIKAIRHVGQQDVFPDPGLYRNAAQFRDRLEALLRATLHTYGV